MGGINKLILGLIPNQSCNLKCEYCYISQFEAWDKPVKFQYSPEQIAKGLSKERLGGISLINLTGNGETLIQPEVIKITELLLKEGHYVEIVTNCTLSKRVNQLLELPDDLLNHLFFKISFHYKELLRLGIIDQFFENVRNIKKSPASFTLELMAYDGIENDIDAIQKICIDNIGAICQATIGRNERKDAGLLSKHSKEEYKKIWKPINSPMMKFKLDMLGVKRKEFCYAGAWSLFVNLCTGEAQPCYWQPYNQNIFNDLDKPILFSPVGHECTQPFCINAHAHLTWGLIPELKTPTYDLMRNRLCNDGSEWLKKDCKNFFQTRLYDNNIEYSEFKKTVYTFLYPLRVIIWFFNDGENNIARVKKHLVRKTKWKKDRNGKNKK